VTTGRRRPDPTTALAHEVVGADTALVWSREPEAVSWGTLKLLAPELYELGRLRLVETRLALLATLQRDGVPRISPIEPYFSGKELVFGALEWSLKAHDLLRDPRCALHSVVTGPDNGEPEFKLYGDAHQADEDLRRSCSEGWWNAGTPRDAIVFVMRIARAVSIEWNIQTTEMLIRRWSGSRGYSATHRTYP
jgi:hypothetical protein